VHYALGRVTLVGVGRIGLGELIVMAFVCVPIAVTLAGIFAAGYFVGKTKGRREALGERPRA
jgi:hypothetical protein